MKKMLIIGIAGGSGSGKSTAAELIADEFGEEVTASAPRRLLQSSARKNVRGKNKAELRLSGCVRYGAYVKAYSAT